MKPHYSGTAEVTFLFLLHHSDTEVFGWWVGGGRAACRLVPGSSDAKIISVRVTSIIIH